LSICSEKSVLQNWALPAKEQSSSKNSGTLNNQFRLVSFRCDVRLRFLPMHFEPQILPGVFLIRPTPFCDDRGVFRRHFCAREFSAHGIVSNVLQSNISENHRALTMRGFHFQEAPYGEGKTLTCLKGRLFDIIVDMRPDSPTYKQWLSFELNDQNRHSIHIPPGCANAFLTMADDTLVYYVVSEYYQPNAERGIRWNDPFFGFRWPAEPRFISQKDAQWPDYTPKNV
jgi:dTDP-4-dehydrorhamnose 3,5-epimerase